MRPNACLRFPSTVLRSIEDFEHFHKENSDLLDERYRREQSLGTKRPELSVDGVCGLCLRVTHFVSRTAGGETTADGRLVPNWREQQTCGCEHFLNSRQRSLLHLAQPHLGAADWYRLAVLGHDDALSHYLRTLLPDLQLWPRLDAGASSAGEVRLAAATGSQHMIISADQLQSVVPLDTTLTEIARVLMPGGLFLFTIPFSFGARATQSISPPGGAAQAIVAAGPVHQFGWDITDRLRKAGFEDCVAHCYWSEELGYLGPFNMTFLAYR